MALGMDQPPAPTVGYDRQTGHAWSMPGPGEKTPGPNSRVCEHTHTHTQTHINIHECTQAQQTPRQQGEKRHGQPGGSTRGSKMTHTQRCAHLDSKRTHVRGGPGMPRGACEPGHTETEKAGSSFGDRRHESQTHGAPAVRTRPRPDSTENALPELGHAGHPPRGGATAEHTHACTHHRHTHMDTCSHRQARGGRGD